LKIIDDRSVMYNYAESKDAIGTQVDQDADFIGIDLGAETVAYLENLTRSGLVTAPSARTREILTGTSEHTVGDEGHGAANRDA
jgi:hypothetical protein